MDWQVCELVRLRDRCPALGSAGTDHDSQTPKRSRGVLCTSAKLHTSIHSTSIPEMAILSGTVLDSGETVMRANGCFWLL